MDRHLPPRLAVTCIQGRWIEKIVVSMDERASTDARFSWLRRALPALRNLDMLARTQLESEGRHGD